MLLREVTPDTGVMLDKFRTIRYVHAVNPDGSDGPWLGFLEQLSKEDIAPEYLAKLLDGLPKEADGWGLWAIYPISRNNRYTVVKHAMAYAVGSKHAAKQLRDYIAERNLEGVDDVGE